MSKRFISPQQSGDRKKPKLDISVSDHNFPLSQNAGFNNVADDFDDIDDELLLQASQACEQACNASVLPAYSQFVPPALTSTQLPIEPSPSTSKGVFSFKKPTTGQTYASSTALKDKCDRISSPLRGIVTNVGNTETIDLTDNYFNDKVLNAQDTDYMYRQLLQLKEENAKLKSENGNLLEKCVTKEGEASILRTQLKTHQIAVDNARLEKIKTHEQAQIQWSEKLNAVKKQLADVKTKLDSKNLEIINIKEKCKMLESNKIKLTQITVAGNEMSRVNNSVIVPNSFLASQSKRSKTVSATVQTDNNPQFLKLSKPCTLVKTKLTEILPLIMESPTDTEYSILDYNEKLKRPTDFSPNKSRILSSFYRPLSGSDYCGNKSKVKINLSAIYEDLMCIAACNNDVDKVQDHYINIFDTTRAALESVQCQLEVVSKRLTSAFQKEMDRRYMETTTTYMVVGERDLIAGKALFKEEQSILARRMTAVLQSVLAEAKVVPFFNKPSPTAQASTKNRVNEFVDLLCRICALIDSNCCGLFYSGLMLSILLVVETLVAHHQLDGARLLDIVKHVIPCRAMAFVPCRLLRVLCAARDADLKTLCSGSAGNLRFDYDQGVLLFKIDSCLLQVFLRQVESALKCMEQQGLVSQVVDTTSHLLQLYHAIAPSQDSEQKNKCKCGNLLVQVIVHALKICSTMLDPALTETEKPSRQQSELLGVCRSGLQALYQCSLLDVQFTSQLGYNEGQLVQFCELLRQFPHNEFYGTMLTEMISTFQAVGEEVSSSFHRQAWLRSFDTFSLAD